MIIRIPAGFAQVSPGDLFRGDRSANVLLASRRFLVASAST
jgi:hypothetical protein